MIGGALLDGEVLPRVGAARPRAAEEAVLDDDLVGAEEPRQLAGEVVVPVAVAGVEQHHRRRDVLVDERRVLLEAGAARVRVIDRLVELDLEVAISGVVGRRLGDGRDLGQPAQLFEDVAGRRVDAAVGVARTAVVAARHEERRTQS
jgi:hypothetical protein